MLRALQGSGWAMSSLSVELNDEREPAVSVKLSAPRDISAPEVRAFDWPRGCCSPRTPSF
jgi:hypothetical protein